MSNKLHVKPLTLNIGAEISGINIAEGISDAEIQCIEDAADEYSVLVFRNQIISDEQQIAFSERFGPLELTLKGGIGGGTKIGRSSNVDPATNLIIPIGDPRMKRQFANEFWHSDFTFKPVPPKFSFLSGREITSDVGNTEFASTRAAYAALSDDRKSAVSALRAVHDYVYSRAKVEAPDYLTPEQKKEVQPMPHPMVVTNPRNHRKALFLASYASHIEGVPLQDGRRLLEELITFATQPHFVYVHHWQPFDFVIWDNRATMHRVRPYDYANQRRVMVRTMLSGSSSAEAHA
jgi:alpha-ketoglutarate-dependent 2,4-dichlorophenoxyacetate dioxygenase